MKPTQKISILNPFLLSSPTTSKPGSSIEMIANSPLNAHEDVKITASTDSGIAMTTITKIPTYVQYIRVIEFVRAQQEPSLRTSSILNAEYSAPCNNSHSDNIETSSLKIARTDVSPILNRNTSQAHDHQSVIHRTSRSPTNPNETSASFQTGNSLIGGDIWYNRQNLSRLAMYV